MVESSGSYPGNSAWKLVDGKLLFNCGSQGWDGRNASGPFSPPYWVTFDFGFLRTIDGFALWSSGEGPWDVGGFALLFRNSSADQWVSQPLAASFNANTGDGTLQLFGGFEFTTRQVLWNITSTGGNQVRKIWSLKCLVSD